MNEVAEAAPELTLTAAAAGRIRTLLEEEGNHSLSLRVSSPAVAVPASSTGSGSRNNRATTTTAWNSTASPCWWIR